MLRDKLYMFTLLIVATYIAACARQRELGIRIRSEQNVKP